MKRFAVLTDIDGTIIHSAGFYADGDILVETSGAYSGYMHPSVKNAIGLISNTATIIPVTTRSVDQYRRINWPEGTRPDIAIVTNGANLVTPDANKTGVVSLIDEAEHELWRQEIISTERRLGSFSCVRDTRVVDGSYVLAILNDASRVQGHPSCLDVDTTLKVFREGKKVYYFPPYINKSIALAHVRRQIPDAFVIAAGDSLNDVAMMTYADFAFAPSSLKSCMANRQAVTFIPDEEFEGALMPSILGLIASAPDKCRGGDSSGV